MKTEPNGNIVPCEAITAPVDKKNMPLSMWYRQWSASAHVRRPVKTDVLGKTQQMRDHCDKLEREDEQLKTYIRDAEN